MTHTPSMSNKFELASFLNSYIPRVVSGEYTDSNVEEIIKQAETAYSDDPNAFYYVEHALQCEYLMNIVSTYFNLEVNSNE